jgi:Tol biopolymer transport system component
MSWRLRQLAALGLVVAEVGASGTAIAATTERISVSSAGVQGNADSPGLGRCCAGRVALSRHGRFVAFDSDASNLVPGDTNGVADIYLRDRKHDTTTRLSVASSGAQANGPSSGLAMTPDGRFIAFSSGASNLVAGDTNEVDDIFVRDRRTGTTSRVSVGSSGEQANADAAPKPAISDDGRFVAFASEANNLVSSDRNIDASDVFVHDRQTGRTTLESVRSDGTQGDRFSGWPDISANGRTLAFSSEATNLRTGRQSRSSLGVFVRDRVRGITRRVSEPVIRGAVALATPNNLHLGAGVLLYGRHTDVLAVGLKSGRQRCVACNTTEPAATTFSDPGGISADGRITTFQSMDPGLVAGDTNDTIDVFVRGWMSERAIRVSVSTDGAQARTPTYAAGISPDGRFAAFITWSSAFVSDDTTGLWDIFVRGPLPRHPR